MAHQFIPQGDYTYLNDQPINAILQYNHVSQNPITFDCSDTDLQRVFRYFNVHKTLFTSFFLHHDTYITTLQQNHQALVTLWTDPNFCGFINACIRGYASPAHIEIVVAYLEEVENNGFNYTAINTQNVQARAQALVNRVHNINYTQQPHRRERMLKTMIRYIFNSYISPLTNVIADAYSTRSFFFVVFRGVFGITATTYMNLQINDFYIEHGFLATTWLLAKAIEYATRTNSSPRHVLTIQVSNIAKCLSVYSISTNPEDREILFPAGTVFQKSTDGMFEIMGYNQRFIYDDATRTPNFQYNVNPSQAQIDIHQGYDIHNQIANLAPLYFGSISTQQLTSQAHTSTRLPRRKSSQHQQQRNITRINGVYIYQDGTVDFDMNILQQTHNIVTTENKKGALVTFFYKK